MFRAVVVAARVVLEQVEHRLDPHRLEARLRACRPTALSSVTRLAASSRSVRPAAIRPSRGLLDADEVRVQRLVALVHLDLDVGVRRADDARETRGVASASASAPSEHGHELAVVVDELVDAAPIAASAADSADDADAVAA